MSVLDWFKSGKRARKDITVTRVPAKTISDGAMASSSPATATEQLSQVLKQQQAAPQILVVGNATFSSNLVQYALKMGQRLDCQIVAVNNANMPPALTDQQRERAQEEFYTTATKAGVQFAELADSIGVSFSHLMRIGEEEDIIHEVAEQHPGIRYVLTEPKLEGAADETTLQIPVFDLACSRL